MLDSELSAGERYPLFEKLEPEEQGVCLLLPCKIRQVLHSKGSEKFCGSNRSTHRNLGEFCSGTVETLFRLAFLRLQFAILQSHYSGYHIAWVFHKTNNPKTSRAICGCVVNYVFLKHSKVQFYFRIPYLYASVSVQQWHSQKAFCSPRFYFWRLLIPLLHSVRMTRFGFHPATGETVHLQKDPIPSKFFQELAGTTSEMNK